MRLRVRPGRVAGEISLSGAKNAALPLLSALLLTEKEVVLRRCPLGMSDVALHVGMLRRLGKTVVVDEDGTVACSGAVTSTELRWEERSIRGTLLMLGALLARYGEGKVPLPGGCRLGDRKWDIHETVLERLGARIWVEDGFLCGRAKRGRLVGGDVHLRLRSTGATQNAVIAASLAEGRTRVWNPHVRPELRSLVGLLNRMGARIEIHGQSHIEVLGVRDLQGTSWDVPLDNMEALTWVIAAGVTEGEVVFTEFPWEDLEVPLAFVRESGVEVYRGMHGGALVRGRRRYPMEFSTGPYPGINSDMQPILAVFCTVAEGLSRILDLRFPGRYQYMEELRKLGAKYSIEDALLLVQGVECLHGGVVEAPDLRGGMALVLAGLCADGEVLIGKAEQVLRGYEALEKKARELGVDVAVLEDEE